MRADGGSVIGASPDLQDPRRSSPPPLGPCSSGSGRSRTRFGSCGSTKRTSRSAMPRSWSSASSRKRRSTSAGGMLADGSSATTTFLARSDEVIHVGKILGTSGHALHAHQTVARNDPHHTAYSAPAPFRDSSRPSSSSTRFTQVSYRANRPPRPRQRASTYSAASSFGCRALHELERVEPLLVERDAARGHLQCWLGFRGRAIRRLNSLADARRRPAEQAPK